VGKITFQCDCFSVFGFRMKRIVLVGGEAFLKNFSVHWILSKSLTASQMAKATECSKHSISNISNKLRRFENVRAPPTRVDRRRSITPPMIEALCDRLLNMPGLYVDEMAIIL
jgi:hypothetical protein